MMGFDLSSRPGWESFADLGTILVIIGVAGEGIEIGIKIVERRWEWLKKWYEKHEFAVDIWGAVFWIAVVLGLMIEFKGNGQARIFADKESASLKQSTAGANERVAQLNQVTLNLAAQYDLSTNALAEANKRLAAIKPAKERLIDLLNDLADKDAQEMMQVLRSNRPVVFGVRLDAFRLHQVEDFLKNPETKNLISLKILAREAEIMGMPVALKVELTVSPSLLK